MPLKPFTTDGCSSLFMRAVHAYWRATGRSALSEAVTARCVAHDRAYHPGGSARQRAVADAELMRGVALLGQPFLARLMVMGIGIGGHWVWPFPWRWGYGWNWPRPYIKEN